MTSPPTPGTEIQQAARHLAEGRPIDAVHVLERLAEDLPAYVTAHVLLAKAYESCERPADALAAWHRAYFLMPGSSLVVRQRARLLRQLPPDEEELSSLEAVAEPEAPPLAPAWDEEEWEEPAWDGGPPSEAAPEAPVPFMEGAEAPLEEPAPPSTATEAPPVELEPPPAEELEPPPAEEEAPAEQPDLPPAEEGILSDEGEAPAAEAEAPSVEEDAVQEGEGDELALEEPPVAAADYAEVMPPESFSDPLERGDEAISGEPEADEDDWRLLDETEGPRRATDASSEADVHPPATEEDTFSEDLSVSEAPPSPRAEDSPPPFEDTAPFTWVDDAAPFIRPGTDGGGQEGGGADASPFDLPPLPDDAFYIEPPAEEEASAEEPPAARRPGPPLGGLEDLDTLIEQLENAPRIRPDPHFEDEEAEEDPFGAGEVVSETLARIYEAQRQFGDAARAYEQLALQQPHRAEEFGRKADEMRRRAGA